MKTNWKIVLLEGSCLTGILVMFILPFIQCARVFHNQKYLKRAWSTVYPICMDNEPGFFNPCPEFSNCRMGIF